MPSKTYEFSIAGREEIDEKPLIDTTFCSVILIQPEPVLAQKKSCP
jgi:hypothetical protein